MGSCFSARTKVLQSPLHNGVDSKCVSKDGNRKVTSSYKVSSVLAPQKEGEILVSFNLKSFYLSELKTATRDFSPNGRLGEGGFGSVFKGWIDDHTYTAAKPGTGLVVAVKNLNHGGFQGHREWLTEINYLWQLCHPNIVKLIGYCLEDNHRLLVYEFMPGGSFDKHLFQRGPNSQPISWNLRMKVALGAAKGLAFLHSDPARVIYRDFKTSNILLDLSYNAKLSDFGLAKDCPTGDRSHVSTRIMGTEGYAAPEYMTTGHLTVACDVYSFGVVLLEILSGKQVIDMNRPPEEQNLVQWAKPYLNSKRKICQLMDTRIEGQYSLGEALKAVKLTVQCLQMKDKFRPSMDEVVRALEELQHPQ